VWGSIAARHHSRSPTFPADNLAPRRGCHALDWLFGEYAGSGSRGHGDEPAITERATDKTADGHDRTDQDRHGHRRSPSNGATGVNVLRCRGAACATIHCDIASVRDTGFHRDGVIHRHVSADSHGHSTECTLAWWHRWHGFHAHIRSDRDRTGDGNTHADPAECHTILHANECPHPDGHTDRDPDRASNANGADARSLGPDAAR
jgi:hypothetical protein